MLFTIISLLLMTINQSSAATNVEIYSGTYANTGGNEVSGSGKIETGDVSVKSQVKTEVGTGEGAGKVEVDIEAEANGEKVEKKVEKKITNENINIDAKVNLQTGNDTPPPESDSGCVKSDDQPKAGFINSIVTSVKDFFSKITSVFS